MSTCINAGRRALADLPIRPEIAEALSQQGFSHATEIQELAIPVLVTGCDAMVRSRTGTGKTLAFALPTLERLTEGAREPEILVVTPTRELAHQVAAVYAKIGRAIGARVATLTGGEAYGDQLRALRGGASVVVGTPGRLNDHLATGALDLSGCRMVVLDEADEILDMGFQEDLDKLLGALPDDRQTLLFSATLSEGVERIARKKMRDPRRIGLDDGLEASATLTHVVYEVNRGTKDLALINVLRAERPELAILFCHTKADTEKLYQRLSAERFAVGYLNGDLPQARRTETLEAFRSRRIHLLVATDVAARGIDVRGVTHVVNVDIPREAETYVHRAGRTGRAGHEGRVLNFVTPADRGKMRKIGQDANIEITREAVPQKADVQARLRERFFEGMVVRIDAGTADSWREYAAELLANTEAEGLVAALLSEIQGASGRLTGGYNVEVPAPPAAMPAREGKRPESGRAGVRRIPGDADSAVSGTGNDGAPKREKPKRAQRERTPGDLEAGMVRLQLNIGKVDRVVPGYLVRTICAKAGVTAEALGAITIQSRHSFVDVRSQVAHLVLGAMDGSRGERGHRWEVVRARA